MCVPRSVGFMIITEYISFFTAKESLAVAIERSFSYEGVVSDAVQP